MKLRMAFLAAARRAYRARTGLAAVAVDLHGRLVGARATDASQWHVLAGARRDALGESVRWGESCVFCPAPGLLSWIVPLMEGETLRGGVSGGEVSVEEEGPAGRAAAVNYLAQAGMKRAAAERYVARRPTRSVAAARAAAEALFEAVYPPGPPRPEILRRNREAAQQQRGIAEAIHEAKRAGGASPWSLDDERTLLALLRVGDRSAARRMLNRILAAIFLRTPRVAVVRARVIELLGYLVRAAIEDHPVLEPLMSRHASWVERLIGAREFEEVCGAMRSALEEFMDAIELQGHNRGNERVRQALEFIAAHFTEPVRLADAARAAGIGPHRLAHLLRECTGRTMVQHIRRLRVEQARALLESSDRPCADLAYELGFGDQSYFTKQFRTLTGVTPARYRRLHRRGRA